MKISMKDYNKKKQIKQGIWNYKTKYYYKDESTNAIIGPKSYETEIKVVRLESGFYTATVIGTEYIVFFNLIRMNNNYVIHGDNTVDDRRYELAPVKTKCGKIIEVEGYDHSIKGLMILEGGIEARCYSKISAKWIRCE